MTPSAPSNFGKYMALTAALLGWLFDGLEMGLFPLTARSALIDLAVPGKDRFADAQERLEFEQEAREYLAGLELKERLSKSLPPSSQEHFSDEEIRTALEAKAIEDLPRWLGIITAFFLVGAATGGVLFGWLGDRIGRVRAMILSVLTYAVFTGLCGFVRTPAEIGILRFIAALGMGGEWSLGVALINEIWPGKSRAFLAGLIGAAANVGYLIIALVGAVVINNVIHIREMLFDMDLSESWVDYLVTPQNKGWRLLMMFGAAPALITLFIRFFVPESHRWEKERNRGATSHWANRDLIAVLIGAMAACGIIVLWTLDDQTLATPLRFISATMDEASAALGLRIVGTIFGLVIVTSGYLYPVMQYLRRAETAEGTASTQGGTLRIMLLGACLSGVALLGTWGTVQQIPPWSGALADAPKDAASWVQIWSATGAILGTILAALIADYLGRRITYTLLCLGSLIIVPALFLTTEVFDNRFLFLVFLAGAITASFYGWLPLYLPELFPTRVRATGQGFGFNFGRIIAAIGVLQLGNLKGLFTPYGWTDANVFSFLACVYVVGMILIWFAPETKGKPLPE